MYPFFSIASRVLYEERVIEGLQRLRWADFASSPSEGLARAVRIGLLAALSALRVR